MSTIKRTINYNKFKMLKENRPLYKSNLKKLKGSIQGKNLTEYLPIVVNEKLEVIDGQHRLELCKLLKIPVYYTIAKGTNIKDVIRLNTNSKVWSLRDYIWFHVKEGRDDYKYLVDINNDQNIPFTLIGSILMNEPCRRTVTEHMKNGSFKILDGRLKFAEGFFLILDSFRKCAPVVVKNDRYFTGAVEFLFRNQPTRVLGVLENLKKYAFDIKRLGSRNDYLSFFEDVYNFRKSEKNRVRFF